MGQITLSLKIKKGLWISYTCLKNDRIACDYELLIEDKEIFENFILGNHP